MILNCEVLLQGRFDDKTTRCLFSVVRPTVQNERCDKRVTFDHVRCTVKHRPCSTTVGNTDDGGM